MTVVGSKTRTRPNHWNWKTETRSRFNLNVRSLPPCLFPLHANQVRFVEVGGAQ